MDQPMPGICRLTLDRPKVHNAFDDQLIAALTLHLEQAAADPAVRAVLLTGAGKSFSAGADLGWMQRSADYEAAENLADARALARLMQTLDRLPKPTVARIDGAALGGGVGLICCCDIAIASDRAIFGTTEIRLGLIPAVIGPYVVRAVGERQARAMFVTGRRLGADEAFRLGLVHQVVPAETLDQAVEGQLLTLGEAGPAAQAAAKRFLSEIANRPIDDVLIDETAQRIAALRASPEGREGVRAFLEKRQPDWRN